MRKAGIPYDLASIDPDNDQETLRCYVGYWTSSELKKLAYFNHLDFAKGLGWQAHEVAVETPQIYMSGDVVPPNVVVQLNIAGCLLAGAIAGGNVYTYNPHKWKGQRAKPPHHLEIWEELTPKERLLFPAEILSTVGKKRVKLTVPEYIERGIELNAPRYYRKPLRQYDAAVTNQLDCAGIGLVHLGRLPKP